MKPKIDCLELIYAWSVCARSILMCILFHTAKQLLPGMDRISLLRRGRQINWDKWFLMDILTSSLSVSTETNSLWTNGFLLLMGLKALTFGIQSIAYGELDRERERETIDCSKRSAYMSRVCCHRVFVRLRERQLTHSLAHSLSLSRRLCVLCV